MTHRLVSICTLTQWVIISDMNLNTSSVPVQHDVVHSVRGHQTDEIFVRSSGNLLDSRGRSSIDKKVHSYQANNASQILLPNTSLRIQTLTTSMSTIANWRLVVNIIKPNENLIRITKLMSPCRNTSQKLSKHLNMSNVTILDCLS